MIIRPARPSDVPQLVRLCAAHAAYEQAPPVPENLAELLTAALSAPDPRLWCLLAVDGDATIGYLSLTREFSTWRGREYAHLDCLYVEEPYRGRGVGRSLVDAAVRRARERGLDEMQWQTPEWNADGIGFYDRLGAVWSPKFRYRLRSPGAESGPLPSGRKDCPSRSAAMVWCRTSGRRCCGCWLIAAG